MERLDFDSDMFGVRVFRADELPDDDGLRECDLLYLFTKKEVPDEILCKYNGCLTDRRFTYVKDLVLKETPEPDEVHPGRFSIVHDKDLSERDRSDLHELAFQSGYRCRFSNDPLMPREWFRLMYGTWMDNSVRGTAADMVLAARVEGRYKAMATLCRKPSHAASIGLIAVDRDMRGSGLGRKLVLEVLNRCAIELCVRTCTADTHGDDPKACAFYEALGFELADRVNVYHLWPNGAPS